MVSSQALSSAKEYKCRFCKETGNFNDPLFIPCDCKGALIYTHSKCLRKWIQTKNVNECEICHHPYKKKYFNKFSLDYRYTAKNQKMGCCGITFILLFVFGHLITVFGFFIISDFEFTEKNIKEKKVCLILDVLSLSTALLTLGALLISKHSYSFSDKLDFLITKLFPNQTIEISSEMTLRGLDSED